jgi:hypothetical protein
VIRQVKQQCNKKSSKAALHTPQRVRCRRLERPLVFRRNSAATGAAALQHRLRRTTHTPTHALPETREAAIFALYFFTSVLRGALIMASLPLHLRHLPRACRTCSDAEMNYNSPGVYGHLNLFGKGMGFVCRVGLRRRRRPAQQKSRACGDVLCAGWVRFTSLYCLGKEKDPKERITTAVRTLRGLEHVRPLPL